MSSESSNFFDALDEINFNADAVPDVLPEDSLAKGLWGVSNAEQRFELVDQLRDDGKTSKKRKNRHHHQHHRCRDEPQAPDEDSSSADETSTREITKSVKRHLDKKVEEMRAALLRAEFIARFKADLKIFLKSKYTSDYISEPGEDVLETSGPEDEIDHAEAAVAKRNAWHRELHRRAKCRFPANC